jgi:hypothetical protein
MSRRRDRPPPAPRGPPLRPVAPGAPALAPPPRAPRSRSLTHGGLRSQTAPREGQGWRVRGSPGWPAPTRGSARRSRSTAASGRSPTTRLLERRGYRVTSGAARRGRRGLPPQGGQDGEPTRWFFTRSIPRARSQASAAPPPAGRADLRGRTYRHAETDEGRTRTSRASAFRFTWEYWDDGHQRNLAVGGSRRPRRVLPAPISIAPRSPRAPPEDDDPGERRRAAAVAGRCRRRAGREESWREGGEANPFVAAAVIGLSHPALLLRPAVRRASPSVWR